MCVHVGVEREGGSEIVCVCMWGWREGGVVRLCVCVHVGVEREGGSEIVCVCMWGWRERG